MQLIVLTAPYFFPGEATCLEELLSAGLKKLHLRKPRTEEKEMEALLRQLSPRWSSRLVLHGSQALAERYGIPQIHLSGKERRASAEERPGRSGERPGRKRLLALSTSLHSWEEIKALPAKVPGTGDPGSGQDFEYVFLSPLFDSISKPGYRAGKNLLQRPSGKYPCPVIGLGGIHKENISCMMQGGWEGAALLGWIWQEPRKAAERYKELERIIETHQAIAK